jgi:aryl-alcohol dehydrogenase (NADP+)
MAQKVVRCAVCLHLARISASRLEEATKIAEKRGLTGFSVLQTNYSLVERRELEIELLPAARRRHIDVCGYYALASGYLTGKYRSMVDLSKSARGQVVRKYLEGSGPRVLPRPGTFGTGSGILPR